MAKQNWMRFLEMYNKNLTFDRQMDEQEAARRSKDQQAEDQLGISKGQLEISRANAKSADSYRSQQLKIQGEQASNTAKYQQANLNLTQTHNNAIMQLNNNKFTFEKDQIELDRNTKMAVTENFMTLKSHIQKYGDDGFTTTVEMTNGVPLYKFHLIDPSNKTNSEENVVLLPKDIVDSGNLNPNTDYIPQDPSLKTNSLNWGGDQSSRSGGFPNRYLLMTNTDITDGDTNIAEPISKLGAFRDKILGYGGTEKKNQSYGDIVIKPLDIDTESKRLNDLFSKRPVVNINNNFTDKLMGKYNSPLQTSSNNNDLWILDLGGTDE